MLVTLVARTFIVVCLNKFDEQPNKIELRLIVRGAECSHDGIVSGQSIMQKENEFFHQATNDFYL